MPSTGEVTGVAIGVGVVILLLIMFPLLALLCRHLRGRQSQIRRWGPANHLLVPPCYCYLTVWVEMCPCLEPRVQKFLPKDLSKTGHTSLVMETNGVRPKSARIRDNDRPNASSDAIRPGDDTAPLANNANDAVATRRRVDDASGGGGRVDDVVTPDDDSSSPIVQITVASSESNDDSSDVLDHGHVNMAMDGNDESVN